MVLRTQRTSEANILELDFDQPVLNVGSHPENDVKISGVGVLPFHLTVVQQDNAYRLIPFSEDAQIRQAGKLIDGIAFSLKANETIQIGAYSLQFRPNASPTSVHVIVRQPQIIPSSAPAGQVTFQSFEDAILVSASSQQAEADVEQSASYQLEIINAGPIVASFYITSQGLPDEWVAINPNVLNLNENQRASVTVTVTAPRSPNSQQFSIWKWMMTEA